MKNLTLSAIDETTDFDQLLTWKKNYKNTPEYKKIVQYIFNGEENENLAFLLKEINDDHKKYPNRDFVLLAKDEHGEILGVMVVDTYNIGKNNSSCHIHFILSHPAHTKTGVSKFMLKTFLLNPETYVGTASNEIFANIKKNNTASLSLFKSFGFDVVPDIGTSRFVQLRAPLDELQANLKNPKSFE